MSQNWADSLSLTAEQSIVTLGLFKKKNRNVLKLSIETLIPSYSLTIKIHIDVLY